MPSGFWRFRLPFKESIVQGVMLPTGKVRDLSVQPLSVPAKVSSNGFEGPIQGPGEFLGEVFEVLDIANKEAHERFKHEMNIAGFNGCVKMLPDLTDRLSSDLGIDRRVVAPILASAVDKARLYPPMIVNEQVRKTPNISMITVCQDRLDQLKSTWIEKLAAIGDEDEFVIVAYNDPECAAWAQSIPDDRVRVVRIDTGTWFNLSHARNCGAVRARGKWLAFCDADVHPISGWAEKWIEKAGGKDLIHVDPQDNGHHETIYGTCIIRAERFHKERGYDERIYYRHEDTDMYRRCADSAAKLPGSDLRSITHTEEERFRHIEKADSRGEAERDGMAIMVVPNRTINPNGYGHRHPSQHGNPDLTIVTPITDGFGRVFEHLQNWMQRQDFKGRIQWLVSSDARNPIPYRMGQEVIERTRSPQDPAHTIAPNVLNCWEKIGADKMAFMEADDWYHPDYLPTIDRLLDGWPVVGQANHRVYHVAGRRHHTHSHYWMGILAETALRREAYDDLLRAAAEDKAHYSIDCRFWRRWIKKGGGDYMLFVRDDSHCLSLNMKGLVTNKHHHPYHSPNWEHYKQDGGEKLEQWIGRADAQVYTNEWPEWDVTA